MGEAERGESEGFQRWAGFLSLRQTREGGGQRASAVPAVPICGPDSCSHFGEGEGRGGLCESGKIPADTSAGGRLCPVQPGGRGTPAARRLVLGAWRPPGRAQAGGCLGPGGVGGLPPPRGHMCFLAARRCCAGWGPAGLRAQAAWRWITWCRQQLVPRAGDRELTAWPRWPSERFQACLARRGGCWPRVRAGPSFSAASVGHWHAEARWRGEAGVLGRKWGLWWTGAWRLP